MKVLFLDIDGVLNSTRSLMVTGAGYAGLMEKYDDPKLDPVAVGLLMMAVVKFDFKIVLSSTWRLGFTPGELIHLWQDSMGRYYGWPDFPIIGRTPDLDMYRGFEIEAWLNDHAPVEDFIILDDDKDMLQEHIDGGHFHHVNVHTGLDHRFIDFCHDRYPDVKKPLLIGM